MIDLKSKDFQRLAAFILVVIVALFGVVRFTEATAKTSAERITMGLYQQQVKLCRITQQGRKILNTDIVTVQRKQNNALIQFAKSAENARFASYKVSHLQSDLDAAKSYGTIVITLQNSVFPTLPIPNCNIPKP